MARDEIDEEFLIEHLKLIAMGQRAYEGEPCMHVFEWMAYKLRCKNIVRPLGVRIVNLDQLT